MSGSNRRTLVHSRLSFARIIYDIVRITRSSTTYLVRLWHLLRFNMAAIVGFSWYVICQATPWWLSVSWAVYQSGSSISYGRWQRLIVFHSAHTHTQRSRDAFWLCAILNRLLTLTLTVMTSCELILDSLIGYVGVPACSCYIFVPNFEQISPSSMDVY